MAPDLRGQPVTLTANIRKLYAFSFLKMALFPMAIITLFWKDHIGLSLSEILLLQAIFSLATLLMEYPSGYLSDRLGYRLTLSLASLLGIAGWSWYTVAGSFAGVLGAEILLGISYAFISGADSALLFETLKADGQEEHYARLDGRMTGWAQCGEAAGALFAGTLYAFAPLTPFFLQIAVWALAFILTRTLREPPHLHQGTLSAGVTEAIQISRHALLENRRLRYGIALAALLGLASFIPVWLIQPTMQLAGVPLAWFGPVWAGANLTVALFSLLSHRLSFHLGHRGMIILCLCLVVAGYVGLGLVESVWGFVFYYLLTAMRGLQGPLLRHHLQRESRPGTRASILSLKSLVFRLLFVASSPLVGRLADNQGLATTFLLLAAAFALLLLPFAILFLHSQATRPNTVKD
ncbi:MAG: MFS transporter [Desulfuromonadales bacterium]